MDQGDHAFRDMSRLIFLTPQTNPSECVLAPIFIARPTIGVLKLSRTSHAPVAQGIERRVADPKAAGSNPARRTPDQTHLTPRTNFDVLVMAGSGLIHFADGEVSEWLMVPLSKSGVVMSHRGFESHPLRRPFGSARGRSLEGSHSLA